MLTYSAQPDTVEQVQAEIQKWFGNRSKGKEPPCIFFRKPQESTLSIFISQASEDLKFEMVERCLYFQFKQQRLNLNLEKFLIRTAYKGEKLCLNIDRDPDSEYHFLASTKLSIRRSTHGSSGRSRALKTTSQTLRSMKLLPLRQTI